MRMASVGILTVAVLLGGVAVVGTRVYIASSTRPEPAAVAPQAMILTARADIPFGAPLTAENTALSPWGGDQIPAGAFTTLEAAVGDPPRFARTAIAAGEPVLAARVTDPGVRPTLSSALTGSKRAVTIRVNDVLGVAGLVAPGDRVDVMLTRIEPSHDGGASVDILLSGVTVLAIDQEANARLGGKGDLRTVTLEVEAEMAQKLALAKEVGTLSLALRGSNDTNDHAGRRITLDDLLGRPVETAEASPPAADPPPPDAEEPQAGPEASPEPVRHTIEVYHGTTRATFDVAG